jgi:hypothetical protein
MSANVYPFNLSIVLSFHISSISKNALMPVGDEGAVAACRYNIRRGSQLSDVISVRWKAVHDMNWVHTWPMKGSLVPPGILSVSPTENAVPGTELAMGFSIALERPSLSSVTSGDSLALSN